MIRIINTEWPYPLFCLAPRQLCEVLTHLKNALVTDYKGRRISQQLITQVLQTSLIDIILRSV